MPIRLDLKAGNALELAFPDSLLELTTRKLVQRRMRAKETP